jgi:NAD(P)-dependent dehydrogenase (short-subunit alcohol dehydrogenase family)
MVNTKWLEGSTILLTGSTRGIGRELAEQCAEGGANVVINGTDGRNVDDVAASMRTKHEHVLGVQADICDPEQAQRLVEQAIEEFGQLDGLFNIVGASGVRGGLLDTSTAELHEIVDRNIGTMIHTTRSAMPHLEKANGRVMNMGSVSSLIAAPNYGGYNLAKFGVRGATEQLRREHPDVSFTLACPGPIQGGDKPRTPGGTSLPALDPEVLASEILHAVGKRKHTIIRPRKMLALNMLLKVWPSLGERIVASFSSRPERKK